MSRFLIETASILEGRVRLSADESRHATQVLRLKKGDAVELLDGKGGVYEGVLSEISDGRVFVKLKEVYPAKNRLSLVRVTLAVSVIKPERMEQLVEKACELGVDAIVPLRTERSIVKLSRERWESKVARLRKIAAEACKQCGLPKVPEISPVVEFKAFLEGIRGYDGILLPTLSVQGDILYRVLSNIQPGRILALIGPEGDFSPKETDLAISKGAVPVSLGPLVLRSETAAWALLTAVQFYFREVKGGAT